MSSTGGKSDGARRIGNHQGYRWFEFDGDRFVGELVKKCPEIFIGKYLVMTALDSSPLTLSEEQKQAGWVRRGDLVYSPKLLSLEEVHGGEFDEWYLFEQPMAEQWPDVFVNDWGWSLAPTEDTAIRTFQASFWRLLERIRPETYIADGNTLIVATRSRQTAGAIEKAFVDKSKK